ncbi:MAG: hypothetical protein ACFB22_10130 [Rhodothalassiaceae bacterium]
MIERFRCGLLQGGLEGHRIAGSSEGLDGGEALRRSDVTALANVDDGRGSDHCHDGAVQEVNGAQAGLRLLAKTFDQSLSARCIAAIEGIRSREAIDLPCIQSVVEVHLIKFSPFRCLGNCKKGHSKQGRKPKDKQKRTPSDRHNFSQRIKIVVSQSERNCLLKSF